MRGQIDRRAGAIHQRIDSYLHQVRALARHPAALPVAFVCGILAERLNLPGIKRVYGFLTSQMKIMQIVSSLIGSYKPADLLSALQYQRQSGHE
ncbi:hypothetical protein [Nitrincola iocasae]|uniref:Uncharacterized protein n=1 Tax=Nitrincola iocasae TaxID=2614693 RepID=A0A5J6LG33_9GAMM|nr:hypothetical protein [Nitrincola iocasae]QEW07524.1 hypothetical protein F5I99_14035 [Nitrincola iocasae]